MPHAVRGHIPTFLRNEYDYVSVTIAVFDLLLACAAAIQLLRIIISERRQAIALNAPANGGTKGSFSAGSGGPHGTFGSGDSQAFSPQLLAAAGAAPHTVVGPQAPDLNHNVNHHASSNTGGKWSGKKLFHLIIVACMFVRGTFQAVNPLYVSNPSFLSTGLWIIWMESGSFLFFLAYFMLLLYWADFYYRVQQTAPHKRWMDRLKAPMFVLLALCAVAFVVAAAVFVPSSGEESFFPFSSLVSPFPSPVCHVFSF
jgi:hypothetical protein